MSIGGSLAFSQERFCAIPQTPLQSLFSTLDIARDGGLVQAKLFPDFTHVEPLTVVEKQAVPLSLGHVLSQGTHEIALELLVLGGVVI